MIVIPDSAVQTDAVLCLLMRQNRRLWRVVKAYYLSSVPIDEKCRQMHLERSKFYRLANRAKGWVGYHLDLVDAD